MSHDSTFLSGVVEGFYGRPWSVAQREELFGWLCSWRLNTYFYAPKDDLKHRAIWRTSYDTTELDGMRHLVGACHERGLQFIYGLSPGLDICFSDAQEREAIRQRFAQMIELGCQHFALLFDDLPGEISQADQQAYASVAAAQCDVTNDVYRWLREQVPGGRFLFCPTPYCDRMDRWNLGGAGYLDTLGQQLDLAIDVIWTGPEIISREIPVESIQRLSDRIGRKPLIWDNLHANDYDGRRAFVGPYSGRPLELKNHVAGILSNPQNEFPLNFIPLHTLAQYVAASHGYSPRDAYLAAAGDWLPRFTGPRSSLAFDDLLLLGDCFYLPHEEGEAAREAFALIRNLLDQTVSEWGDRERQFLELKKRIVGIFETLTELYDRELFYAWSRRIWDLREELDLFGSVFANKRQGKELATVETHHPGTYLGGIVAKLQTLLQMDSLGRFSTRDQ